MSCRVARERGRSYDALHGAQVEVVVQVADHVMEAARLLTPVRHVQPAIIIAEIGRQDLAAGEPVQCRVPSIRDLAFELDDFAFFDHATRVTTVPDAVMHAGQDRRRDEVGVGVGAGRTVFEAQITFVRNRDTDRDVPVIRAPVRFDRRKHLRAQPPV